MKKISNLILAICILFINITNLQAASGSISVNTNSLNIVRGSSASFRITASNAAGKISVYSSNTSIARVNASEFFLDNDYKTITVSAVANGTATIKVVLKDAATYGNVDLSGKEYTIKVTVYTPQSGDASLKSLTIENMELETLENNTFVGYAPLGTQMLNISAQAQSDKATVSTIDPNVTEGWNEKDFSIIAENGTKNDFFIRIYVEEKPTVYYHETLGIVKNYDKVTAPEGFEKKETELNGEKITYFSHEKLNLLYLADAENQKAFYLYDLENDTVSELYQPLLIDGKRYLKATIDPQNYVSYDEQFDPSTIRIAETDLACWKYRAVNMEAYSLIPLINEDGDEMVYSYDSQTQTLQRFTLPIYPEEPDNSKLYFVIGVAAGSAGFISLIMALIFANRKVRKN